MFEPSCSGERRMPRHNHMVLVGIISVSILLVGWASAQVPEAPQPHLVPVIKRPAAVVLPPSRLPHLPAMPYPYPRVYVYPVVPLSPSPDADIPSRPPSGAMQGYLRLEIQPPEAEIYVDGQRIGRSRDLSRPAMVAVSPGGHRVEVRADGRGSQIWVSVSAGEMVEINQDLTPMRPENPTPAVKRWTTPSRRQAYP